jgi:hypothetical protein
MNAEPLVKREFAGKPAIVAEKLAHHISYTT